MQQHIQTIDTAVLAWALDMARMEDAFERHYDTRWHDPTMRNERLAWIAAWRAASAQAHARYEYDRMQRSTTP